ncbi:hypothetical protein EI94DRAFT_1772848 [Lactarius quietus]|nr:hypothetical protein EI94DRAFT_1772848 [Lactarius quietus]
MFPHSLHLVCERIHAEMEAAKPHLRMSTDDVSPEFIEHWDIHHIMEPVACDTTPTLKAILEAVGESKVSVAKSKTAKLKNHCTALLIIMSQIHFLRSWYLAKVSIGLGLQSWACGTSRQMIDVLHRTCLTVSYASIATMVQALVDCSIERAKATSLIPHALAYDNINISSSIFVEQGPNAMSKVQSGTFAVIYELFNARLEDMDIKPLSYISQTAVTIVCILAKYVKGFEMYSRLVHPTRRPLPTGCKTVFHPLHASTIEEASVDGNLLVHDDVYLVQLNNLTYWECCEIFQLGFGGFHLTMNLLWCILETHQGTLNQTGSLTHFFAILEKAQLGGEHPNYHTLLAALTQILNSLILDAWRSECGYSSFNAFAGANPTPDDLLACAHQIIEKYASPEPVCEPVKSKAPPRESGSRVETLFATKGIYSNWDRLGNIAAGINYLQLVKKRVTNSLRSGYRGTTHTDVDTSGLIW